MDETMSEMPHVASSSFVYLSRKRIEEISPSLKDDIDVKQETYLRRSYCTFLQDLGMRLKVPQVTIATAIVFCHRFFLRQSHAKNDRFTMATVCMFLAGKVEETPHKLEDVMRVSQEVQKTRNPAAAAAAQKGKEELSKVELRERMFAGEYLLLSTLAFDLNIFHPYKPLLAAVKRLKVAQQSLAQVAWNFVNDGLRTSLCLQFAPEKIAAGAIFLAAEFLKVKLPGQWMADMGVKLRDVQEVAHQMLELYEQQKERSRSGSASAPTESAGLLSSSKSAPAHTSIQQYQSHLSSRGVRHTGGAVSSKSPAENGGSGSHGHSGMSGVREEVEGEGVSEGRVGGGELRVMEDDDDDDDDAMSLDSADGGQGATVNGGRLSPAGASMHSTVLREDAGFESSAAVNGVGAMASPAGVHGDVKEDREKDHTVRGAPDPETEEQRIAWDLLEDVAIEGSTGKDTKVGVDRKEGKKLLPANVIETLAKKLRKPEGRNTKRLTSRAEVDVDGMDRDGDMEVGDVERRGQVLPDYQSVAEVEANEEDGELVSKLESSVAQAEDDKLFGRNSQSAAKVEEDSIEEGELPDNSNGSSASHSSLSGAPHGANCVDDRDDKDGSNRKLDAKVRMSRSVGLKDNGNNSQGVGRDVKRQYDPELNSEANSLKKHKFVIN